MFKRLSTTLLAVAALTFSTVSGVPAASAAGADVVDNDVSINVVGGERAAAGAYPWVAKLLIGTPDGIVDCGGSLVSPDVIITAQHCMTGQIDSFEARYGHTQWRRGSVVYGESFHNGAGIPRGDWSVVKLSDSAAVNIFPMVATDTTYDRGPSFRALGWGATSAGGPSSRHLLQVDLPFIDDRTCGTGRSEICAGDWENGDIDTCQGDSGGPLLHLNDGNPVLVGITSWGRGCADAGHPGHYTQVSTFARDMAWAIRDLGGTMYTPSR